MIYQEARYHGFKGREIRVLRRVESLSLDGLLAISAQLGTLRRRGVREFELFGIVWDLPIIRRFVLDRIRNFRNAPRRV